jgi:hypothetical protein
VLVQRGRGRTWPLRDGKLWYGLLGIGQVVDKSGGELDAGGSCL